MGVSMTPDLWSQRQMDEAVDEVGEFAGCPGPQGSTFLGASGVPVTHRKLQGKNLLSVARSSAGTHVSRCWFQTNKTEGTRRRSGASRKHPAEGP